MITHVSSCIHLCVHVSIVRVFLIAVSFTQAKQVNRKWSQGRISAARVLLRPVDAEPDRQRLENPGKIMANIG